jgi:hypothetical protein
VAVCVWVGGQGRLVLKTTKKTETN